VQQNIGEAHFRLGNNDQARIAYAESRQGFESAKDIGSAGRVLQGAAVNELVVGRFPAAEQAYNESITLCTSAKDPECIARAQVGLAFALAAQKRFDDAITWYGRSLISFNDLKMEDAGARARIGLAEAYYGKEQYEKAVEEAVSARRTGVALESDDVLWRALVSQARAERKLAKPVEALGTARAALLAVQRMAKAALDRPDQAVPRDTTIAFAIVALLQAEAGDAAGAFLTSEQMRAHALRSWLAPNERDISHGMTDAERDEERKLSMELTSLIVKRDRQKDLPKPDAALIEKLNASITEMTERRTAARQKLFTRLPDLETWRALGQPATVDDLTLLLDSPDKALIEFIVDEHDVVVIVGTGASTEESAMTITAHVVPMERQTLAERIVVALEGKHLTSVDAWRKGSVDLFKILPSDVLDRFALAKKIIVSPDDMLWRVPFEAMPIETHYLADQAIVTYAMSVASVIRVPPAPAPDPKAPIVAVAAPQLPDALVETLKSTAPTWTIRSADASTAEVQRITKQLAQEDAATEPAPIVLSGTDATSARLSSARDVVGPLHIAAPFRVNSGGPLFSPILLDRPFEARELFKMDPIASVAMFSDPAALSKRDGAEAAAIVNWAWRSAGTTSVIFRRWGVEPPSASLRPESDPRTEVIGKFYEELRAGKSAPDALHAARASVRATEEGRAPAAWAGWLIFAGR
jgi:hypothetical protein